MRSYRVRFWDINTRKNRRRPYEVRWCVEDRVFSRSFATKALANSHRSDLMSAANRGEPFDGDTGLPPSMTRDDGTTWFVHAREYVDMKWPKAAAKSRVSMAEALATVTPSLVRDQRGAPDSATLRRALLGWAFNPARRASVAQPPEIAAALRWIERASLPLARLSDAKVVRGALDCLALTLAGRPAAAQTVRRKRSVFYNALNYAVELDRLPANPVDRVQWKAPEPAATVDRRVVANPAQVRELLAAVGQVGRTGGPRLVAFFALLYFAVLRPSEAIAVRQQDCTLPATGWGRLDLAASRPSSGRQWTDAGAVHELRGLKHRPRNSVRTVPIPPELVVILRQHIDRFGTAEDGRLFRTVNGAVYQPSAYWRVWSTARRLAFTAEQVDSPLAARPYDLRHGGVSLWLNAGVPATEVAERAGHSVDVLLKVYAHCIDGTQEAANKRIDAALNVPAGSTPDATDDPRRPEVA